MAHFCAFETKNGTSLVNYSYLVDGTKLSALQDSGESLCIGDRSCIERAPVLVYFMCAQIYM